MKKILFLTATIAVLLLAIATTNQGVSANNPKSALGAPDKLARAEAKSREVLAQRLGDLGVNDVSELKTKRVFEDDSAMLHTHVQQTYQGVPVFGGEAIVHLNADESVAAVTDDFAKSISVSTLPNITADDAIARAVAAYGCSDCLTAAPEAELFVLRYKGRDRLAYRVQLRREDGTPATAMPAYFIDAHNGSKVWNYNNLQTASGSSLYSGTVTINTYFNGSTYYMEDISRKIGTFDNRNTTSSTYRFTDADNIWNSTTQRAGVDAHYGAAKVYDYYLNVHGRRGIDGAGGPAYYTSADGVTGLISSKVHYGVNYNNAFWNGSYMTYGDGNGSSFSPLVTLDICGHEMTHGVTERTARLTYSNESGALNESMSDVFGAMVERSVQGQTSNTWKIGEQCYTPSVGGDALRYMDNPHAASNSGYTADDDPDHYSERYTGTADSGGVHINSGIANKAFYLLAVGGTHHRGGSMTGIGADAAARIWYRALTSYMTSSTNFRGARTATLNAAAAIYGSGSANYNAVAQAWSLCGVV
ncbi:MAG TPA: M4 family metallopeptidase [Pyrinomonadaceae bacterium]|jgi:Zn-dependent metalloprotease